MSQYLTAEELEKLKKELNYLKTVEMRKVAELIRHTASQGDLSENAAYDDAKERQGFLQGKILELKEKINNAEIVEKKKTGKVEIGSMVSIFLDGEKERFEIAGAGQTDLKKDKLSYESPIGKAIFGRKTGDKVKIKTGENEINCEILKIE